MKVFRVLCFCVVNVMLASGHGVDFDPGELPWAMVDQVYAPPSFVILGGALCPTGDANFTSQGKLPPGLTISGIGQFGGVPEQTGIFRFSIRIADSCGETVKPLILVVTGAPILVASDKTLEFHYRQGGPNPGSQPWLVSGSWPNLAYRVDGHGTPWLRAVPKRGRTPRLGASTEADVVEVQVVTEGLEPGTHEALLTVTTWMGVNAPTVKVRVLIE